MSIWAHINGTVRYDVLSIGSPMVEPEFNTYKWDDSGKSIDECNVPYGSEGSITVNKYDVYRRKNQAFVTYAFSGDLRDYSFEENSKKMEEWIQSLVPDEKAGHWIRQAIFQIEYEDHDETIIYIYDDELKKFKRGENSEQS